MVADVSDIAAREAGPEPAKPAHEPIAVVGVGLRFPGGARSLDEFADFLAHGRSGIRPIPEDRWDIEAFTPQQPGEPGKIRASRGGFLDRIDQFDPAFFNISPKEAAFIDPQQRMLLETGWEALEHANIDPTPLRGGNGGVYVGASSIDYAMELDKIPYPELDGHLAAGITMFPLSGRLSYFLGWRGPSMSVDTACSSALTALHLAIHGLRAGECDIALCGGVNALHHPRIPVMFSHAQMLAPDGECKTFDDAADGYVRAEGCAVVVLKRLSVAQRAGDNVLAVIPGMAVGQDGESAGLTVPNGAAQELVIRRALEDAGLKPRDIQYVEAHGTGTPLGDPIELGAINDVFTDSHTAHAPLVVGSVKTNLGHMEPVSGLVGMIKVIAQLRAGAVFPHLNFTHPSDRIPWSTYPVTVPTEQLPWRATVRRAVVNSFGFAGAIAAAVVEQAPVPGPEAATPEPIGAVLTLSAKTETALREQARAYRGLAEDRPGVDVERLCRASNVGRAHFPSRLGAVIRDRTELLRVLDEASGIDRPRVDKVRRIGFLFAGQGAQRFGMGAGLYHRFAEFARVVDLCDELFAEPLGRSVGALLRGEAADPAAIDQTGFTQPALFTFEYALARLWLSWGIRPQVVLGHSIGEVAAATVAGVFDLPDAVRLVAARGRLMGSVRTPGAMAAVAAPADEVRPLLDGHPDLALAAVNAPEQCVVSGGRDALAEVVAALRERAVRVDELAVSQGFHSPLMHEVLDEFRAALAGITLGAPRITLVSSVTGAAARRSEVTDLEYWVRHIVEPVLFGAGVRAAAQRGRHGFVEIGPSTTLTALATQSVAADEHLWLPSLRRDDPAAQTPLRSLAALYTAGVTVDWSTVHSGRREAGLTLPTYPFQRKRYWLPVPRNAGAAAVGGVQRHPLLGAREKPDGDTFVATCTTHAPGYLADAVVDGAVSLPFAGYVELLFAVQDAVVGHTSLVVCDLALHEPLHLNENTAVEVRTRVMRATGDRYTVEVTSVRDDGEHRHATATLAPATDRTTPSGVPARPPAAENAGDAVDGSSAEDLYLDLAAVGRVYGERFRLVRAVDEAGDGSVHAVIATRPASAVEQFPVEMLESAVLALSAVGTEGPRYTPVGALAVRLHKKPRGSRLDVVAAVREADRRRVADLAVYEGDRLVAELSGLELAPVAASSDDQAFCHRLEWLRGPLPEHRDPDARHVVALRGAGRIGDRAPGDPQLSFVADVPALRAALVDPSVTDVCWFWDTTETTETTAGTAESLRAACEHNYRELLDVLAALETTPPNRSLRLWLVTTGAQQLPGDDASAAHRLAAASLWGFGHVLRTENPRLRTTMVDLPVTGDPAALLAECRAGSTGEFQLAFRGGQRFVRRLVPGDGPPADFVVRAGSARTTDFGVVPVEPGPALAAGHVRVRLRAAGVAAGGATADADPAADPRVGGGCGTVTVAGPGFTVGDDVLVWCDGALRGTVTVPHTALLARPAGLDDAQAAALVTAGGAATRVLAGRAVAGRRLLLRLAGPEPTVPDLASALCVVRLASRAGAEVLVVADPRHAAPLRAWGAHHVLAPGAEPPADVVDLAVPTGEHTPDLASLGELAAAVADGALPPLPVAGFRLEDAGVAWHTADTDRAVVVGWAPAPPPATAVRLREDRGYLVTGGLGGLGLVTARTLVDLGARHLYLVSRRATPTPEAASVLAALRERAEVTVLAADIGSAEDVAALFGQLRATGRQLGGIVHAAGDIGKSLISELTWDLIDEQLRPKVYGGWLLHEASRDMDLDFFVLYSSIASVIGGATQGHYAAASAFLDALATWRSRQGLPGLAINWGAWAGVGMSARLAPELAAEIERGGVRFFSPRRGLRALGELLGGSAAQRVVGEYDWSRIAGAGPVPDGLYARLAGPADTAEADTTLRDLLALPDARRRGAVRDLVCAAVATALHFEDPDELDRAAEFTALGLDSLTGMEVRGGLVRTLRLDLPASVAFDHPTVERLGDFLHEQLGPAPQDEGGTRD